MTDRIVNALIRCRRNDDVAEASFELVKKEVGLWVRELPHSMTGSAESSITTVTEDLLKISPLLGKLRSGSSDFSLHLAYSPHEHGRLVLTSELCDLAGECGFAIEIVAYSGD